MKLFKNRAEVNAERREYRNALALQEACFYGNKTIVKLLIENGADVNAKGGKYGNALQAASYYGYKSIVRLLLENGAEVKENGGEHGNALHTWSIISFSVLLFLLVIPLFTIYFLIVTHSHRHNAVVYSL